MRKDKTYRLSPQASQDLEVIYEYSFESFGIKKADNYLETINQAFQAITEHPEIARDAGSIYHGLKVFHVSSHMIFFEITTYGAAIIRILHKSMDFIRHF